MVAARTHINLPFIILWRPIFNFLDKTSARDTKYICIIELRHITTYEWSIIKMMNRVVHCGGGVEKT